MKTGWFGGALRRISRGTLSAANRAVLQLYLASEARQTQEAPPVPSRTRLRVSLLAHVYYPELLDEILACWMNMPSGAACHLTTPADTAEIVHARVSALQRVTVTVVENRGRDIAPFLTILRSGVLDEDDAVLKIHSKQSPHLAHGALLRRAMFTSLAGRPAVIERILTVMADPSVGMVGWRRVFMSSPRQWHTNRSRVEALVATLSPPAEPRLAFFGGSMFWFRPAALRSIAALPLSIEDFEPEAGQLDGTLHHALERCFAIAAAASGFSVRDTHGNVLIDAQSATETASSAEAAKP
jgi:lipopolysaccharide biosynthesis protein